MVKHYLGAIKFTFVAKLNRAIPSYIGRNRVKSSWIQHYYYFSSLNNFTLIKRALQHKSMDTLVGKSKQIVEFMSLSLSCPSQQQYLLITSLGMTPGRGAQKYFFFFWMEKGSIAYLDQQSWSSPNSTSPVESKAKKNLGKLHGLTLYSLLNSNTLLVKLKVQNYVSEWSIHKEM